MAKRQPEHQHIPYHRHVPHMISHAWLVIPNVRQHSTGCKILQISELRKPSESIINHCKTPSIMHPLHSLLFTYSHLIQLIFTWNRMAEQNRRDSEHQSAILRSLISVNSGCSFRNLALSELASQHGHWKQKPCRIHGETYTPYIV